jgi:hypothetical protein
MLHSETIARVIHADRVRDLERAARDHRLLAPADELVTDRQPINRPRVSPATGRNACGDSAGLPA